MRVPSLHPEPIGPQQVVRWGRLARMGLFDRLRRGGTQGTSAPTGGERTGSTRVRAASKEDERHLREWLLARRGVEGYVEPRTAVSEVTLLLVAHDGEWTRRRVPSVKWAHAFCSDHQTPCYDAAVVGVPARMREWNRTHKRR